MIIVSIMKVMMMIMILVMRMIMITIRIDFIYENSQKNMFKW
jgi:hypothetical protein